MFSVETSVVHVRDVERNADELEKRKTERVVYLELFVPLFFADLFVHLTAQHSHDS